MNEYEIKLSQQDLQVMYQALGELPLKMAFDLFVKLKAEQQKQDKEKAISLPGI